MDYNVASREAQERSAENRPALHTFASAASVMGLKGDLRLFDEYEEEADIFLDIEAVLTGAYDGLIAQLGERWLDPRIYAPAADAASPRQAVGAPFLLATASFDPQFPLAGADDAAKGAGHAWQSALARAEPRHVRSVESIRRRVWALRRAGISIIDGRDTYEILGSKVLWKIKFYYAIKIAEDLDSNTENIDLISAIEGDGDRSFLLICGDPLDGAVDFSLGCGVYIGMPLCELGRALPQARPMLVSEVKAIATCWCATFGDPKRFNAQWDWQHGVRPPPVEFVIGGELPIPRGEVTLLAGPGGIGKSAMALELAIKLASPRSPNEGAATWLGQELPHDERGKHCIFLTAEDTHGAIAGRRCRLDPAGRSNATLETVCISGSADFDRFLEPYTSVDRKDLPDGFPLPRLIVLDCLRALTDADLEDQVKAGREINRLSDLARRFDCAVLLLHHVVKSRTTFKGLADVLAGTAGSGVLTQRVRHALGMYRQPDGLIRIGVMKVNLDGVVLHERGLLFKRNPEAMTLEPVGDDEEPEGDDRPPARPKASRRAPAAKPAKRAPAAPRKAATKPKATAKPSPQACRDSDDAAVLAVIQRHEKSGAPIKMSNDPEGIYGLDAPELSGISTTRRKGAVARLSGLRRLRVSQENALTTVA